LSSSLDLVIPNPRTAEDEDDGVDAVILSVVVVVVVEVPRTRVVIRWSKLEQDSLSS
jgi:hypothetical protein